MHYEFCSRTDPGLARSNNEDSVAVDEEARLALLADGMGGYNAGEVASGMATAFIRAELGRWLTQAGEQANARELRRAMEICVENANRAVFNAANANPNYAGMGTTLVVAVFQAQRLVLGHIGDSRCYRLRAGQLTQVTRDHSLLQEQLEAGLITEEEAAVSDQKNLVTRALGVEDTVLLDVNEHRVEPGDCFLLCSDGLNDMIDDRAIASILQLDAPLQDRADRLVDAANANGGRDNVSVVLVRAGPGRGRRGLLSRLLGQ
ncbi:Stp1/IreP family PP2C-type Ser/Thr phosphatase [Ramlibacter sp. AN1015]|uniref:Stp1/IreP family PP2C-type Ser/Thr phosphatase n=1 Tax=Ramlibacter sp. AN1015 TaxID=3133428 RepID=UPI0030C52EEB